MAEEVEKVNRDLVLRDKDGKRYSVRYDQVNAMLLNEFLKEHRKNEEQEKTIAELKSGMTALAATVKEQAAQIQKVSAQLERANLHRRWSTIPKTGWSWDCVLAIDSNGFTVRPSSTQPEELGHRRR